jgi:hypothetical protein
MVLLLHLCLPFASITSTLNTRGYVEASIPIHTHREFNEHDWNLYVWRCWNRSWRIARAMQRPKATAVSKVFADAAAAGSVREEHTFTWSMFMWVTRLLVLKVITVTILLR